MYGLIRTLVEHTERPMFQQCQRMKSAIRYLFKAPVRFVGVSARRLRQPAKTDFKRSSELVDHPSMNLQRPPLSRRAESLQTAARELRVVQLSAMDGHGQLQEEFCIG